MHGLLKILRRAGNLVDHGMTYSGNGRPGRMKMNIRVTRKSKLAYGYTAGTVQTPSGLGVAEPTHRDYEGTIRQVDAMIAADRVLASYRSGGTCWRYAWWVKIHGAWHKIIGFKGVNDLLLRYHGKYLDDAIDIVVV